MFLCGEKRSALFRKYKSATQQAITNEHIVWLKKNVFGITKNKTIMPVSTSSNGKPVTLPPLQLRSEAVQEIISHNPGFIIRHGITLFLIILVLMVIACWFIQYPDLVSANAKLTSLNAPKAVTTKTDGKLIKLNVKEGDTVKTNEVIGYMESIANEGEVIQASILLDSINMLLHNKKAEQITAYFNKVYSRLGELQTSYQTFIQAFIVFRNYLSDGFYIHKKILLAADMQNLRKLNTNMLLQKELQVKDLSLTQRTFDMNDTLKKQKVISDLDFRNEESKLLMKQLSLPQMDAALLSNESLQNEKQKEILELENSIAQQQQIFEQAINTFKSQVDEWKKKYLLTAPVSGTVSYTSFLQENQQLKPGEIICYINPGNSNYYAEIAIPQANFGKIRTGQQVLLKFAAYPDAEFGSVVGKIDFISRIPTDSGYMAKVSLPNGLITNYKKQIQYRDGLTANGEIITENMRLMQRFYYNIYKQVKRD